jgi:hypothetical protein
LKYLRPDDLEKLSGYIILLNFHTNLSDGGTAQITRVIVKAIAPLSDGGTAHLSGVILHRLTTVFFSGEMWVFNQLIVFGST